MPGRRSIGRVAFVVCVLVILLSAGATLAGNAPVGGGGSCGGQLENDGTQGQQQAYDNGLYTCTSGSSWAAEAFIVGNVLQSGSAPSCNSTDAGMLEWTGTAMQYCDGTNWDTLSSSADVLAAGSTGYVQFNNGGALGGSANLYWNNTSGYLGIGTASPTGPLQVYGTGSSVIYATTSSGSAPVMYLNNVGLTVNRPTTNAGALVTFQSPDNSSSRAILNLTGNGGSINTLFAASNGNVGIGTTVPTSQFDVYNSSGPTLTLDNGTSAFTLNANGAVNFNTTVAHNYLFNQAGSPTMDISSTGNVGIGTTAPGGTLSINGSAAIGSYGGTGTTPPSNDLIVGGNVGIGTTVPLIPLHIAESIANSGGGIAVVNSNNASIRVWEDSVNNARISGNSNDSLPILLNGGGSGNVGIGTTSPILPLSVSANSNNTAGSGSIWIGNANNAAQAFDIRLDNTSVNLNFDGETGGVWNNYLTIQRSNGDVGIGSSSPTVALDVNGALYGHSVSIGTTTVNWTSGNVQGTSQSCGAFSFSGMQDGGSYTLTVEGTTTGTCSFSNTDSPTLTFKLPSNFGASTSGTMTLFHFTRRGTNVFVTWMPGY